MVLAEGARAQGFANDLARGDDLLDIDAEVSALAEMLLLRDVEPPLVAGVFGDSGSGKSFAMHLMQRRMAEIRALSVSTAQAWPAQTDAATQSTFPWVGHVYLVRFDAWTYAKSDLWASLMQTVLRDLNRALTMEAELFATPELLCQGGDAARALLLDPGGDGTPAAEGGDRLWQELSRQKHAERAALDTLEAELRERRAALAAAKVELEQRLDDELEALARHDAWRSLIGGVGGRIAPIKRALVALIDPHEKGPLSALGPGIVDTWRGIVAQGFPAIALVSVLAVATIATARAIGLLEDYLPHVLGPTFVAVAATAYRASSNWQAALSKGKDAYDEQLRRARLRRAEERDRAREAIVEQQRRELAASAAGQGNLVALERDVAELTAKASQQRQRIGVTAAFVSLSDFVSTRLDQQAYDTRLGLLHQVQRDLLDLTGGLVVNGRDTDETKQHKMELFPRGPARVVLFIDDLDGCPPGKVVEVLEAAQLLVKTKLFVVVVAMDERFVARALEKSYAGVLRERGEATGLRFIEKIVQIPYRVRRIRGEGVRRYLAAQMRVSGWPPRGGAEGTRDSLAVLPERVVEFSADEFEDLRAACDEVGLSPRSIKRLVNVYKLLKIIWYRPNRYPEPIAEERRALVRLLALSARAPVVMQHVIEELASSIGTSDEGFPAAVARVAGECRDRHAAREVALVVRATAALSDTAPLTLNRMSPENYHLLQSFCFASEAGQLPESSWSGPED